MPDAAATPDYVDLLGLPFKRGARGPKSFDCYGLAREMFTRAGIFVPDFESPEDLQGTDQLIGRNTGRWRKVAYGTINSLVTLRVRGLQAHVGFVIERDRFIHAFEHTGVTTERLTNGSFKPLGFYTYA